MVPKLRIVIHLRMYTVVGERSIVLRRQTERTAGGTRSDYAGISSAKIREKRIRRKPKVSWGRLIHPGLVDPKPRPKGVGDGESVNIQIPLITRYQSRSDAGGKTLDRLDVVV